MSQLVLIAAELRDLLTPADLADLDVTWMAAAEPTPQGDFVAIVPLLSRWVGGTELKHLPNLRIVANVAVGYNNVDVVAAEMRGNAAFAQHDDAVAHADELGQLRRDQDDGQSLLRELGDHAVDLGLALDVDALGRLVEDEQARPRRQPL